MATNIAPFSSTSEPSSLGFDFALFSRPEHRFAWSEVALLTTLFLAPLAFGAVQPWAWGAVAFAVALAWFLWSWSGIRGGALRFTWTPLLLPGCALLALGLVQLLAHRTEDPAATRESIVKFASDLAIFFLAVQLWSSRSSGAYRGVSLAIAIFTFGVALFSVLQFLASPTAIFGVVKPRWGGWVFGSYVNHNHYAGLMELLIPVVLCNLLSLRGRGRRAPESVLMGFSLVVAAASVLLSGSRGGWTALAIDTCLITAVLFRGPIPFRRRPLAVALLAAGAAVGLLALWISPAQISNRLASVRDISRAQDVSVVQRGLVARDSLRIFADHPWTGAGLGSFATVYPRYRSFASNLEWDHAHNDYVEALAETGLAGTAIIATALLLFFACVLSNLRARADGDGGWIRLGAAIGCLGILAHSLADFNLHIPANAAWFSFLAGLAVSSTAGRRDRNVDLDRKRESTCTRLEAV